MNKLLFFLLILSSAGSYASKARMQALANSFHFVDAQTVYKRPIDLIYLDNFVLFEGGETAAISAEDNAEAMISYSLKENHRIALSLGHQEASVVEARQFINVLSGSNLELAQNPLHFFYAVDDAVTSYAAGLFYSTKDDKLTGLKESSAGLSLGAEFGKFQVNILYVATNNVKAAAGKQFDGDGYWQALASYLSDTTLFEFTYKTSKPRLSTEAAGVATLTESHTQDVATLGLADSNILGDILGENEFFWGAQIVSIRLNCNYNLSIACSKTFTNTTVPMWFGVEAQAADWMVFRGAIRQSFLINISKDNIGYPAGSVSGATGSVTDLGAGANDTLVTAGVGLKFKNLTLDGVLSTASTQVVDAHNFLSQVAVVYSF